MLFCLFNGWKVNCPFKMACVQRILVSFRECNGLHQKMGLPKVEESSRTQAVCKVYVRESPPKQLHKVYLVPPF